MEEIKKGEYVRTNDGIIGRVIEVKNNCTKIEENSIYWVEDKDITAHSFRIIDILEEGDYVNGHLVVGKDENTFDQKTIVTEVDGKNGGIRHFYAEKRIDTILTHEQYEQYSFKVKEDKQNDNK